MMKNKSLKDKFKNNILVRPLYRKVGRKTGPKRLISINLDNTYELGGHGVQVKRQILSDINGEVTLNIAKAILPGICENVFKTDSNEVKRIKIDADRSVNDSANQVKMLTRAESDLQSESLSKNNKSEKMVQAERIMILRSVPDTWLRPFPAPARPEESCCSILFRCFACQLGVATALTLWTLVATLVIHSFEGPYELQVSVDFEKAQNQVVIDLATELRQITPLSPKWREAIEQRIAEERQLTMVAVGRGARAQPGHFWDLPGTFLFAVYVMTALGFGAPVPHTLWGRSSALIYALVAVPAHIYLMVNASTCLIINLESICCRSRGTPQVIHYESEDKMTKIPTDKNKENHNCSRNSELLKNSKQANFGRKLLSFLCIPCACRCVPLAALTYYGCGAVLFGVLRDSHAIDIFMFPLEFTTTGGLEHVKGYIRVLYGFYVEGAMVLLSCALATLKRHSSTRINSVADNYRLFQVERP